MDFRVTVDESPSAAIVRVSGEIDAYNTPAFGRSVKASLERGQAHLVLDFERVDYIDSCGLGVLIAVLKALSARRGSVHVVLAQEHLKRLLSITGLGRVLSVHDSLDAALAAVRQTAPGSKRHPFSLAAADRIAPWSAG
ncbi:MAG: STAS domain-containing protein [Candidatus Eremiobacteraeota bacterium]|nr:STAS domain-containing protein [Candidatus Eremiobacteraeota bacterium]